MKAWEEEIKTIIREYKDGDESKLTYKEVEDLCNIIRGKIKLYEGLITEKEYLEETKPNKNSLKCDEHNELYNKFVILDGDPIGGKEFDLERNEKGEPMFFNSPEDAYLFIKNERNGGMWPIVVDSTYSITQKSFSVDLQPITLDFIKAHRDLFVFCHTCRCLHLNLKLVWTDSRGVERIKLLFNNPNGKGINIDSAINEEDLEERVNVLNGKVLCFGCGSEALSSAVGDSEIEEYSNYYSGILGGDEDGL